MCAVSQTDVDLTRMHEAYVSARRRYAEELAKTIALLRLGEFAEAFVDQREREIEAFERFRVARQIYLHYIQDKEREAA